MDLAVLAYTAAGFCEDCNDPLDYMRVRNFLTSSSKVSKKGPAVIIIIIIEV
jgi:hypothetical protein